MEQHLWRVSCVMRRFQTLVGWAPACQLSYARISPLCVRVCGDVQAGCVLMCTVLLTQNCVKHLLLMKTGHEMRGPPGWG